MSAPPPGKPPVPPRRSGANTAKADVVEEETTPADYSPKLGPAPMPPLDDGSSATDFGENQVSNVNAEHSGSGNSPVTTPWTPTKPTRKLALDGFSPHRAPTPPPKFTQAHPSSPSGFQRVSPQVIGGQRMSEPAASSDACPPPIESSGSASPGHRTTFGRLPAGNPGENAGRSQLPPPSLWTPPLVVSTSGVRPIRTTTFGPAATAKTPPALPPRKTPSPSPTGEGKNVFPGSSERLKPRPPLSPPSLQVHGGYQSASSETHTSASGSASAPSIRTAADSESRPLPGPPSAKSPTVAKPHPPPRKQPPANDPGSNQ